MRVVKAKREEVQVIRRHSMVGEECHPEEKKQKATRSNQVMVEDSHAVTQEGHVTVGSSSSSTKTTQDTRMGTTDNPHEAPQKLRTAGTRGVACQRAMTQDGQVRRPSMRTSILIAESHDRLLVTAGRFKSLGLHLKTADKLVAV